MKTMGWKIREPKLYRLGIVYNIYREKKTRYMIAFPMLLIFFWSGIQGWEKLQ